MAYIIASPCINTKDTACVKVCPVDCIHPNPNNPDEVEEFERVDMLYIDPDECIDCGLCEPECPVDAIYADSDVPKEEEKFIQINRDYFKNKK